MSFNKIRTTAFLLVFFSFFFTASSMALKKPEIHHELEVKLLPDRQKLLGKASITLPEAKPEMHFLLAHSARVNQVNLEGKKLAYTFSNGILEVKLPRERNGLEATLEISYQGLFDDEVHPGYTEDPTQGVSSTIKKEGSFLSGRSGWYPDPRQGPATWSITIIAPPGYLAVTAGKLVEQSTTSEHSRSVWKVDYPLRDLTLSAGPYQVGTDLDGDIPVYTYFYPQSTDLKTDYLQATRRHLEFYQELLGPYPFEKFAVVENFFPTGYGFPSWTLLGSAVIRLPFIMETSLPHEIAHSWWGNGVRVDYSQGNWSEAVTTYVADYLLLERSSDKEAHEYRRRILRGYSSLVTEKNDFPLSRFMSRDSRESQVIGYGKGAMIFHMLRKKVGDEVFWNGLRLMAGENMFQEVGWNDFAELFSDLADKDLKPFFEQWVQKPGAPLLTLQKVSFTGQEGDWTVRGIVRQEEPFFKLRLPLYLETKEQPVKAELLMEGDEKSFVLKSESMPLRLSVDPETHIFRRLHPEEIAPTVESVRGSESLTAVFADGLSEQEVLAAGMLLQTLNREDVRMVSEKNFANEKMHNDDVLFLGLPRNFADPLLDLIERKELEAGDFLSDSMSVSGQEKALFVALNPGGRPDTTWAYFISSSPEAARDAARRIPHYGSYSYLLFDKGEIRSRDTWEPENSPLEHDFTDQNLK